MSSFTSSNLASYDQNRATLPLPSFQSQHHHLGSTLTALLKPRRSHFPPSKPTKPSSCSIPSRRRTTPLQSAAQPIAATSSVSPSSPARASNPGRSSQATGSSSAQPVAAGFPKSFVVAAALSHHFLFSAKSLSHTPWSILTN
ncbi:hypothetical protein M0R45_036805 [Rubus argutus]|uniref:Uncharacterized protein n=1 Tax=Rubus argutus TaxID=59490 RepID=A0AAW1VYC7_RUBAR